MGFILGFLFVGCFCCFVLFVFVVVSLFACLLFVLR